MKFTDSDIDDFTSVLHTLTDLENNGIILEHAVFVTSNDVMFMVTYEDPEYQIEIQPSFPAKTDSVESYLDTEMQKAKLPSQPKKLWIDSQYQESDAGWPPQGS